MEATENREVKTFKEVHAELEMESSLLGKNHNISDFKRKGEFLRDAGFINSIATKLYTGITENHHLFEEYSRKYQGRYKFILRPQLERICEKYNLYVRNLGFFLGDIPEPNIKEIMNFKIHLEDLPMEVARVAVDVLELGAHNTELQFAPVGLTSSQMERNPYHGYSINMQQHNLVLRTISEADSYSERNYRNQPKDDAIIDFSINGKKITERRRKSIAEARWEARSCHPSIAAVKEMFALEAMENKRRIPDQAELQASGQVDLDPIVLFPVFKRRQVENGRFFSEHNGYLIVTAWGDEANDELVINHKNN